MVSPVPFCADESCQDRADLARCYIGRYGSDQHQAGKAAGGLTEALALAAEVRAAGLEDHEVGCMLSTSLGVASAFSRRAGRALGGSGWAVAACGDRSGGFRIRGRHDAAC